MNSIYKVMIAICMSLALLPISYARPGVARSGGVAKQQGKQFRAKRTVVNSVGNKKAPSNNSEGFLERLQEDQARDAQTKFENAMKAVIQPVSGVKRVSSQDISEAVKKLNKVAQMDEKSVRNLQQAINNHKGIASAVVNLAKNSASVNKGDVRVALQFVSHMNKVNPVGANVVGSGEAVLLAISSRVDEIVKNWSGSEKASVMGFMTTYMKNFSVIKGSAGAVTATLNERGFKSLKDQVERLREIERGCKKAA